MGLTGTKEGCGTGECGACAILVDGESRLSCLMLAAQLEGRSITTVEGLDEKENEIGVQDAEIQRRERELIATVLKPAEIERRRIEALANAEKQKLVTEAEGRASAIRAQGEAEADVIFMKGEAEAKAMNVKAEAYQEYNQAAVVDKLISSMPEVVRALAAPLANVDKITIVSTGDGEAAGMNKITGDLTKIAAQIPALFETLSGMKLSDLLGKVRQIGDKTEKDQPAAQ